MYSITFFLSAAEQLQRYESYTVHPDNTQIKVESQHITNLITV